MTGQVGANARRQLARLSSVWDQGQHVLITGETGSGKTTLARHLDEIRVSRGGHVVVMATKLLPDETLKRDYAGWTRWTKWKRSYGRHDRKILLWPKLEGMKPREALPIQREIFQHALDRIGQVGGWTVHIDEGYYWCDPEFMNMKKDLALIYAQGRSAGITAITGAQRPSHLPLILYSSSDHVFAGRARENMDAKRLAEIGGRTSSKELMLRMDSQSKHDFLWIPKGKDWEPEPFNLRQ